MSAESTLQRLQHGYRVHGDRLVVAERADFFVGLAFYADGRHVDAHRGGERLPHPLDVRKYFRLLGNHDGIDVGHGEPGLPDDLDGTRQQVDAVGILPCRIRIWKMPPDVTLRARAEDGVYD